VLGGPRFVAPSDKVNVAVIGAGGQGAPTRAPSCRRTTARSSPSPTRRVMDMSKWYYGGLAGRLP